MKTLTSAKGKISHWDVPLEDCIKVYELACGERDGGRGKSFGKSSSSYSFSRRGKCVRGVLLLLLLGALLIGWVGFWSSLSER